MKKQTFLQGTMILLGASLINHLLGFIPKIILPRMIGAEGVGLFKMSAPFFMVLITLVTGGIRLAISKLVAESEHGKQCYRAKDVLIVGLLFTVMLGVVCMLFCLFFAKWLSYGVFTDQRIYYSLITLSPIIPVVCVSSVFRGYFLGKQNMIPAGTSSVVEATSRVLFMFCFSLALLPYGMAKATSGAVLGILVSDVAGMLVLLWYFHREEQGSFFSPLRAYTPMNKRKEALLLLKKLLRISIPVTGSKWVRSLSYFIESIVTTRSLVLAGVSKVAVTAQYGILQGMVIPLVLFPSALTTSLATALIPSISESQSQGDHVTTQRHIYQTIKLMLVTGTPFAVFLYVLAQPLCAVLYNDGSIAPLLKLMAPFSLFLYAYEPLQATLQALDRPGKALRNTCIGAIIKMGCIFSLSSQPQFGITGTALAVCMHAVVVTLLNGYCIRKRIGFSFPLIELLKTSINFIVITVATHGLLLTIRPFTCHFTQCIACILFGILCYMISMIATKTIGWHHLHKFPVFQRWTMKLSKKV